MTTTHYCLERQSPQFYHKMTFQMDEKARAQASYDQLLRYQKQLRLEGAIRLRVVRHA